MRPWSGSHRMRVGCWIKPDAACSCRRSRVRKLTQSGHPIAAAASEQQRGAQQSLVQRLSIGFTCQTTPDASHRPTLPGANRHCYAATPAKAGAYG
jgi:hypothetical protein